MEYLSRCTLIVMLVVVDVLNDFFAVSVDSRFLTF